MATASSSVYQRLQVWAGWLLLLLLGECTLGSSGRWLEIGPLSIRMVLFAACFLITLPLVLHSFPKAMGNPPVVLTLLFGLWYALCALIGWRAGNRPGFIAADITAMLTLALTPGFLLVMARRTMLLRAAQVIFAGSTLLSVCTTAIHFLLSGGNPELIEGVNRFLNAHSLGGLALLSTGMHRIYMKSQIFTQVGLILGVWFLGCSTGKKRALLYLCEALQLFNLILSFTRGMWLGFALSALFLLALEFRHWKQFLTIGGITAGITALLILLSCALYRGPYVPVEILNRFSPSLIVLPDNPGNPLPAEPDLNGDGILSESEQQSLVDQNNALAVTLRAETMAAARKLAGQSPLIGHGLGTNLDGMREDGKIEYMYWDILIKTGIIGLFLFLAVFLYAPLRRLGGELKARSVTGNTPWTSDVFLWHALLVSYLGVCINSYFNPFLSNPMGIMIMLITVSASYVLTGNPKRKDAQE